MKNRDHVSKKDAEEPTQVPNGVHLLPAWGGATVANELIQRLLDEEDEELIERFHRRKSPE